MLYKEEERAVQEMELKRLSNMNSSSAYELLVKSYKKRIFYHIYSMTRDYEASLDLTHEVFLRALKEKRLFDKDFKIMAWLYRVSRNLSLNYLRSKDIRSSFEVIDCKSCYESAPSTIEKEEEKRLLNKVVEKLPTKFKEIIVLRYYDELSYEEIGEVLGIKIGTVMSRLFRAKERLLREYKRLSTSNFKKRGER